MKRYSVVVAIVLAFFFFGLNRGGCATSQNDDVWVAVSVIDGRLSTSAEYYGRMERDQFDQITANSLTNGFFKLKETAWLDDNQGVMRMANSMSRGVSRGYGKTSYFRVEWITRIILLAEEFVQRHFPVDSVGQE